MSDIIVDIVKKVVNCLAPGVERQLGYLLNYDANFENLKAEKQKLEDERTDIQRRVSEAKRNVEKIEEKVENWLVSADEIIDRTAIFIKDEETSNDRCFKGLCPNLETRYHLSKRAEKEVKALVELREKAGRFDRISYPTISEEIWLKSRKGYEAFESRFSTFKSIRSALTDPDISIIGVYGICGIGKTTLVKEVARQAKKDKLFNLVVFSEVSQDVDIKKIQKEIGRKLCFVLQEEDISERANRLYDRLKEEEKILIVLDNIQKHVDLESLGIPFGDDHKGCKILLTARDRNVLLSLGSKDNFLIGSLYKEEAWGFFKMMAGDDVEKGALKSIANDVDACQGLPVALATLARELRSKSVPQWENALQELRTPSIANSDGVPAEACKSIEQRQEEDVDALINCVMNNIGYCNGKPVAAFTIYKCLLHWKSFEAERTSVFDRLSQMIGSAIEKEDDNDHMAYWLSNTSTLLFLLQRSLKTSEATSATRNRKPPTATSLFGRMAMGFRSSPSTANLAPAPSVVRQVEAKYPALLFKQQLLAYVEKIYGIIRDNLKKELSSLLSLCIQAPRTSKGTLRSGRSSGKDSPSSHWQSIIDSLNTLLSTLKQNFVPPVLVQKIFTQSYAYINVQLFNSVLLRRECCTFSNGEYVKAGLAELELWCCKAKKEYAGSSWDELKHIRQAVGFLVTIQKHRISYDEITNDLCPILSVQQLYRICTLYWDDIYNTPNVSPNVISSMRVLMTEDSNDATISNSFLLDDNSSISFSVDDLSNSLQEKDFLDVKAAKKLLENPAFEFLFEA